MCRLMMIAAFTALLSSPLYAQTVQLPTQQIFTVNTTVSVPDRGSIHLGSVSRARESSVSRGLPLLSGPLFGNRGIGREFSTLGAEARVHIIDLNEMDKEVLAAARDGQSLESLAGGGGGATMAELQLALRITSHLGRHSPVRSVGKDAIRASATPSPRPRRLVDDLPWQQQQTESVLEADVPVFHASPQVLDLVDRAARAKQAGLYAVARRLYADAAKQTVGQHRQELLSRSRLTGLGAP